VKFSIIIAGLLLIGFGFSSVYAHTSEQVGPYEIEVGWEEEPPVVGFQNFIVFEITESPSEGVKSGITNAFQNMDVSIKFGGVDKVLDIISDPKPGHYKSKIIPTKTGSTMIQFNGEINGVPIDLTLHPEAVENTAILDFPPRQASSNEEVGALKNAISSLQQEMNDLKSGATTIESSSDGNTYNFAVFGLSLGAAAIILAIIAMLKRK
jgi:HAMP domain-containing protein